VTNHSRRARPALPDPDEPPARAGRRHLIQFPMDAPIRLFGARQRRLGLLQRVAQALAERIGLRTRIADCTLITRITHGRRITRIIYGTRIARISRMVDGTRITRISRIVEGTRITRIARIAVGTRITRISRIGVGTWIARVVHDTPRGRSA
jgi:hypothetical protein